MPAMLDDPAAPTIYRTSGVAPFPDPHDINPPLPQDVFPRQVTLRDRVTTATLVPFSSQHQVPASLLAYLCDQLNKEIDMGDTYPMIEPMSLEKFSSYWFQNFGAVMLLGSIDSPDDVVEGNNWAAECLGSYYIKPNYPGRSSHVCNAGFLVTAAARGKGVGRLMGESYLDWAPRLGYTYSVFNLVYETNVASCRIWDALGFKRIGRVKGAGNMKSYPGQLIDAIIYGRDLGPEGEDFVSEERFDKIKFYLKFNKYPAGADRAEKSRLRSAATHYKLLVEEDKLMLKDKEVISDPQRQYEIARNVHVLQHGGINKTTATIAEKYHWVRIKETVSLVIRNCAHCKELGKAPVVRAADGVIRPPVARPAVVPASAAGRALRLAHHSQTASSHTHPHSHSHSHAHSHAHAHAHTHSHSHAHGAFQGEAGHGSVSPQVLNRSLPPSSSRQAQNMRLRQPTPVSRLQNDYMPLDPQIMEDVRNHLGTFNQSTHSVSPGNQDHHFIEHESDSFQAMLGGGGLHGHGPGTERDPDADADGEADGDLDMLIDDEEDGAIIQLQAEAAARAADAALKTVGREYGR